MTNTSDDPLTDPANHPTPYFARGLQVEPQWIDYNGHLNMAYYNVLFDRAVDEVFAILGLGPDYLKASNHSFYTAEVHVTYLNEIHAGDRVDISVQILDVDEKRLHFFQEMFDAGGTLVATSENMCLHVDMAAKKVAAFPAAIQTRFAAVRRAHGTLPNKPQVGHVIGIRRKPR